MELEPTGGKPYKGMEMHISLQAVKDISCIEDRDDKVLAAARMYAEAGIAIVPIRKGEKILPPSSTGINYSSASKNIKTVEKWYGPNGKYRGFNIGIACGGGGCFALDIDAHEEKNGYEALQTFVDEWGEPVAPMQSTPSGGRHYLFEWEANCVSSTDRLAIGIDTRGGAVPDKNRDTAYASHIVAWPSTTDQGEYTWDKGGEAIHPPEWVVSKLGVSWGGAIGRGNENVGKGDTERQYTEIELAGIVNVINPGECSYEQWLQVGMAISTQMPDKRGLEMWHSWSQRGKTHEPDECQIRWTGFDPAGPIRVGTLIHIAKRFGFDPKTQDAATAGDFENIIDELNSYCAMTLIGGKPRVAFRDPSSGSINLMTKDDFLFWFSNQMIVTSNAEGKVLYQSKARIWLADERRNVASRGIGFMPDGEFISNGYINLWRGWSIQPEEGKWDLYDRHVHDIICDGDDALYTFVLDWIAQMIQNPMELPGTAIVMSGIEGCGKGTLAYFIGQALGQHYAHIINARHLTGNFNSHLMDKLLVFADEVTFGGDRRVAGTLKGIVTEREMISEKKGYEAHPYENRTRLIVASNEDWFIPAGPESRRWLVLRVSGDRANQRDYFDAIYDQMEEGGTAAMLYDLRNREITSNLKEAPKTHALMQQRAIYTVTGDPIVRWWVEQVQLEALPVPSMSTVETVEDIESWPEKCERKALYMAFSEWADAKRYNPNQIKSAGFFYKKMREFGLSDTRETVGNSRGYVWSIPSLSKCKLIATTKTGEEFDNDDES